MLRMFILASLIFHCCPVKGLHRVLGSSLWPALHTPASGPLLLLRATALLEDSLKTAPLVTRVKAQSHDDDRT